MSKSEEIKLTLWRDYLNNTSRTQKEDEFYAKYKLSLTELKETFTSNKQIKLLLEMEEIENENLDYLCERAFLAGFDIAMYLIPYELIKNKA